MRPEPETVTQPGHGGTGRSELIGDLLQAVFLVDVPVGKEGRQINEPERSCTVLQEPPIRTLHEEARLKNEPPVRSRG